MAPLASSTADDTSKAPSSTTHSARVLALVEVVLAFVFVHVTFRCIKHFTAIGALEASSRLNFTPGIVMIVFTVAVLLLCRRNFATYGLTLARGDEGLKLGLFAGLLIIAGAALLMLLRIRHQPGGAPPGMKEGIGYGLGCLVVVGVLARLFRRQPALGSVPLGLCVALLVGLLCLPLVVAWHFQRSLGHTLLTFGWLIVGAGIGEEVFYRGYIHSRINGAFGRPYRLGGIQFGVGTLISTALFGLLHTLNTVDYFHGRFTFAWGFGVAALGTGLIFGCLRDGSGSIVAPAVAHGVLDVLARIPTLIS